MSNVVNVMFFLIPGLVVPCLLLVAQWHPLLLNINLGFPSKVTNPKP